MTQTKSTTPYRQIRASYDDSTITVYQAYSATIAEAAVREQRLNASPDFLVTRMTWIKPSWSWMMYRSGYSKKDEKQARILALKMTHENFQHLLSFAVICEGATLTAEEKQRPVRVQWDPERSPSLQGLPYRSIQIGISNALSKKWTTEWIESIEDVTDTALALKEAVTGNPKLTTDELVERGLVPLERVYEVPRSLRETLKMGY